MNLKSFLAFIIFFSLSKVCLASDERRIYGFQSHILNPPRNPNISSRVIADLYFEQKLDHFSPINTQTWMQRYHMNREFFNETTKEHVFILLGGEWEAVVEWVSYGAWIDTAKQYRALLIYLEHRYYGVSQPFNNLSTENLQFLNIHQALEDTIHFINGINKELNLPSNVKWVAFGGSYAGTMAAWIRKKYPHVVAGAMASSAPLKAVLDFHGYHQTVRESLETHSYNCTSNIRTAYVQLEQEIALCFSGNSTVCRRINEMFQLCPGIEFSQRNDKDLAQLFLSLTSTNFDYIVQNNGMLRLSINDVCNVMVNETFGTELQRLSALNSLVITTLFGGGCLGHSYSSYLQYLSDTTIVAANMMRQWIYQTCTEYGFFQTSNQEDPIFGTRFNVSYFIDLCTDLFGTQFDKALINLGIEATNFRYGATNIATSNIVHFHGTIDPWYSLGKLNTTQDVNDSVIIVEGVSHCVNMQAPSANDPPALTAAREEIDRLIGLWLGVTSSNDSQDTDNNEKPGDGTGSSQTVYALQFFVWSFVGIVLLLS
ncbi:putative serine protease K12H4.7 [Anthonomus grandis grandis]|uniref:putative serine protease K12H4.7 n=1 Tax=Anthonomus grandis grandis TaxID=2921223 RepID=UPI002166B43F|nr:putative serine protease K12H4.7 [Anthonomus grandis grandis]